MSKATCSTSQGSGFEPARLRDFLLQQFPHDTAKAAASVLGISPRTVENWINGRSRPDFSATGKLIACFGAAFLCAVMATPPDWADDARARAELAELERLSAALKSKLRSPE